MIYLVEDDESIRELVVYTLKSQDLDAKGFAKPSLFWKELEKEVPSLILLDIMLSRTQLLNQIWGYEFDGESRTVDVHIRTLRQKLGDAGDLIETVRGIGYKMGK